MSEPNYAGNIIINLANLPEFLRRPILKKRLAEFFSMSQNDQIEIVNNALGAGPRIQFDKFSILFKTWLEILCNLSEEQRNIMFSTYISEIVNNPQKIILFNLDGIFEVYLSLNLEQKQTLSFSLKKIINLFDSESKKRLSLVIPERARKELGF